jgi:hypothetical protein
MIDTVWDVTELKGQSFVLQVVDKETGGWAHIRMDWFRAEGKIVPERTESRRKFIALTAEQKVLLEKWRKTVLRQMRNFCKKT